MWPSIKHKNKIVNFQFESFDYLIFVLDVGRPSKSFWCTKNAKLRARSNDTSMNVVNIYRWWVAIVVNKYYYLFTYMDAWWPTEWSDSIIYFNWILCLLFVVCRKAFELIDSVTIIRARWGCAAHMNEKENWFVPSDPVFDRRIGDHCHRTSRVHYCSWCCSVANIAMSHLWSKWWCGGSIYFPAIELNCSK